MSSNANDECGGDEMAKHINCECGYVIRGETDDELVANAERHMRESHPDLVGQVARDDLIAMADEA
jgi:predicted small metal-binding protein